MATAGKSVDLVLAAQFLQATRDSGYHSLDAALAELIDNSIQAGAAYIWIATPDAGNVATDDCISVLDDGAGMDASELATALQFGGSTRFNDRSGLGRFGMGLPNASLSQARRVDVYSWRRRDQTWHLRVDLDELLSGDQAGLLVRPGREPLPPAYAPLAALSGTLVVWSRLDRTSSVSWKALLRQMNRRLSQKFRLFLSSGTSIKVNASALTAFDPLFLSSSAQTPWLQAREFGGVLSYPVKTNNVQGAMASIEVRFSELPVGRLASLPNEEKRRHGISHAAGISFVRANREIDYGWLLLDKRRENYDDWWRCEIRFPPTLDELFGVTHTKQGVHPSEELRRMLTPELGSIARELNRRARSAHATEGDRRQQAATVAVAAKRDRRLRPLPQPAGAEHGTTTIHGDAHPSRRYRLAVGELEDRRFYRAALCDDEVIITLNQTHEFYERVYHELTSNGAAENATARKQIDILLLALGRSELLARSQQEQIAIDRFLAEWSRAISVFCREY